MRTYTARVTRDGRWWIIDIPELDVTTQARRFRDVPRMAAESIALTTDASMHDIQVTIDVADVAGIDLADSVAAITSARRQRDELEARLSEEVRSLAQRLAAAGITVRDIGDLLGISFQRAHQLIKI
jgi:hypothetical protein